MITGAAGVTTEPTKAGLPNWHGASQGARGHSQGGCGGLGGRERGQLKSFVASSRGLVRAPGPGATHRKGARLGGREWASEGSHRAVGEQRGLPHSPSPLTNAQPGLCTAARPQDLAAGCLGAGTDSRGVEGGRRRRDAPSEGGRSQQARKGRARAGRR